MQGCTATPGAWPKVMPKNDFNLDGYGMLWSYQSIVLQWMICEPIGKIGTPARPTWPQ